MAGCGGGLRMSVERPRRQKTPGIKENRLEKLHGEKTGAREGARGVGRGGRKIKPGETGTENRKDGWRGGQKSLAEGE